MELQLRRAAVADYFQIAPQDFLAVAGTQRFHAGFLRCEAAGDVNGRMAALHAVRDFSLSEYAPQKSVAIPFDHRRDTIDLRGIETKPDNVRHVSSSTA